MYPHYHYPRAKALQIISCTLISIRCVTAGSAACRDLYLDTAPASSTPEPLIWCRPPTWEGCYWRQAAWSGKQITSSRSYWLRVSPVMDLICWLRWVQGEIFTLNLEFFSHFCVMAVPSVIKGFPFIQLRANNNIARGRDFGYMSSLDQLEPLNHWSHGSHLWAVTGALCI